MRLQTSVGSLSATADRPAFANIFAVHDADLHALDRVEQSLRSGGQFAYLWRPTPQWVVAQAPLPASSPDGPAARAAGLVFAEGRECLVTTGAAHTALPFYAEIAMLADEKPERLASLKGDFGFIHFRPDSAIVVCSCAGLVPFYWSRRGTSLAIATRLGDFARYLPDPFSLDPLLNAIAVSGGDYGPGLRSYLHDVFRVPHGSYALLDTRGTMRVRSYWNPQPQRLTPPSRARSREHEERLRDLLLARLRRDLDPAGGNLLTFSGGVDSSALAALAAGTLGLPLWAWSLLPTAPALFAREMVYVEPFLQELGISRHWIRRAARDARLHMMPQAPRVVYHVPHPALCALPSIAGEAEVRVLVGGEFADNFLGGNIGAADWSSAVSPFALLRPLVQSADPLRVAKTWLRCRLQSITRHPAMSQPLTLGSFARKELHDEYRDWYAEREQQIAQDKRPLNLLAQELHEDSWVAMNWEVTSALGIRRSLPFYNREVLELGFEIHPMEWGTPGEKRIERRALRRDVPAHNLLRPNKGHWRTAEMTWPWTTPLPDSLRPVVRDDWYPQPAPLPSAAAESLLQLVLFTQALEWENRRNIAQ